MKVVHISDTHGAKFHTQLEIPECDLLIHSGDIGGRTTAMELYEFLSWFNVQPARKKVWCAGNHDLALDKKWILNTIDPINQGIRQAMYGSAQAVLEQFPSIKYLEYTDYVFEGVKMYGLPITPSFHKQNWAFNADRGDEIKKYVDRIPKDVNILISHGPPYGILDTIPEEYKLTPDEDIHRGCEELRTAMQHKLIDLKLSCFGHIHGNTGVIVAPISNTRHIIFSNGAVINDQYKLVVKKPLIINL